MTDDRVFNVRIHHRGVDHWFQRAVIPTGADVNWTCDLSLCREPLEAGYLVLREYESDHWYCSTSCARLAIEMSYSNH